uniref:Uncharacterized protein n=1 Tax=Ananas comosus var. bracteatus TaxID=296719 RepID=A0A6V7NLB5_ANACO|nr:unnamed protein product [Ananas comosus var. bracteatus]
MDPVVASWIKELVLRQNLPLNITEAPAGGGADAALDHPYTLGTIEALYALRPSPPPSTPTASSPSTSPPRPPTSPGPSPTCGPAASQLLRSPSTAGLASPSLDAEVRELELSVTNIKLRTGIMWRNSRSKALDAMRALLEAEYKDVGPPILELVGETCVGVGMGTGMGMRMRVRQRVVRRLRLRLSSRGTTCVRMRQRVVRGLRGPRRRRRPSRTADATRGRTESGDANTACSPTESGDPDTVGRESDRDAAPKERDAYAARRDRDAATN